MRDADPPVPQFISFGFDDNGRADGMRWAIELFRGRRNPDGTPARATFFLATGAAIDDPELMRHLWRMALLDGHELGNHTLSHHDGAAYGEPEWEREIAAANRDLAALGVTEVSGFRAPYLVHTPALFPVLRRLGFAYDCSLGDAPPPEVDGANLAWPYQLDAGLWELPPHPVVLPGGGTVIGFDYNLWVQRRMSKEEFLAALLHTLELRLHGNRAPLFLGVHSDYYSPECELDFRATCPERRDALVEFIDSVARRPEVRIVPHRAVLDWVRA